MLSWFRIEGFRNQIPNFFFLRVYLMPNKQYWDYIVTVEIKVPAVDREEAKRKMSNELAYFGYDSADATIVRVRPIIKK